MGFAHIIQWQKRGKHCDNCNDRQQSLLLGCYLVCIGSWFHFGHWNGAECIYFHVFIEIVKMNAHFHHTHTLSLCVCLPPCRQIMKNAIFAGAEKCLRYHKLVYSLRSSMNKHINLGILSCFYRLQRVVCAPYFPMMVTINTFEWTAIIHVLICLCVKEFSI